MPVTLRPATLKDSDAVAQCLVRSRSELMPFVPMVHTPREVRDWVHDVLIQSGDVFVAVEEGVVVAVLAVSGSNAESWIEQLYVLPGRTNKGIGTQLLVLAHGILVPPIKLFTFQANTGARRFYERHGYKAIKLTDGSGNEERCPDVLYEWSGPKTAA